MHTSDECTGCHRGMSGGQGNVEETEYLKGRVSCKAQTCSLVQHLRRADQMTMQVVEGPMPWGCARPAQGSGPGSSAGGS